MRLAAKGQGKARQGKARQGKAEPKVFTGHQPPQHQHGGGRGRGRGAKGEGQRKRGRGRGADGSAQCGSWLRLFGGEAGRGATGNHRCPLPCPALPCPARGRGRGVVSPSTPPALIVQLYLSMIHTFAAFITDLQSS